MNRREALKNMAMASLATVVLSGCNFSSDEEVQDYLVDGKLRLDSQHKDHLSRISETFLPLSGRPVELEDQGNFILKMVNDCRTPEETEKFAAGFEQYKKVMRESDLKIDSSEKEEVLAVVKSTLENEESDEDLLFFIGTVKELSLFNLKNSEYYMTEYLDYSLIPPTYNPCAGIEKA